MCEESMKYNSSDGKCSRIRPGRAASAGPSPAPKSACRWIPSAILVLAGFWLAVSPASALDSDSKQPMYIESDTATYDEKKGETEYVGNVKATQGSLEALGDKMVVYQKDGKTDKIVIYGKPARIKQTPEGGKEDMHGIGQRADYFPDTGILILNDKAMTWEGPDPAKSEHVVTSDRIEYDTRNSLYKAGSAHSGNKRVHVTIQPKEEQGQTP
jgi:lipopolysaccharide export system protein LptA